MGINNKGQTLFLSLVVGLGIFMFGILFLNFFPEIITQTRTDLSCSSASLISDGTKAMCLITDGVIPYFIIALISAAMGVVTARFKL